VCRWKAEEGAFSFLGAQRLGLRRVGGLAAFLPLSRGWPTNFHITTNARRRTDQEEL
jgi:hypothetical protein